MRILNKYITLAILIVMFFGCYRASEYEASNRNLNSLFQIHTEKDSIPADGVSRVKIFIDSLPEEINDSDNKVSLDTDFGVFESNNSKHVDLITSLLYDSATNKTLRRTYINLVSDNNVDSVHIKATVKGVSKYKTIYFYRALPDRIKITPSTIYFKPSFTTGISIDVSLFRDTGTVSLKTPVQLTARDEQSHDVGVFQLYNNLTDTNGKCSFNYFFSDTTYRGKIQLKAFVINHDTPIDSVYLITY